MRIGTRGSALALWQARTIAQRIAAGGGPATEIVVIRTSGDERPNEHAHAAPAEDATGPGGVKRMFVKEIEDALIDGRIDLAVHSSKDLPAALPRGLRIGAALPREEPRDAIVLPASNEARGWARVRAAIEQAAGARIGTSSVRRRAALRAVFPSIAFHAIRGNVDTRLRKLDVGDCSALVLAAAGVRRLGLDDRISALIPVEVSVPAPGQGIVAVEVAESAPAEVRTVVARLNDPDAADALHAERAVVQALGGGCQLPLGVLARIDGQDIEIVGFVASLDGARVVRASARGNRGRAAAIGDQLAAQLIDGGAAEILDSARK
jgi:hydroxymethylbilane synthase